MKIAIGSDHGGYVLKTRLADILKEKGVSVEDLGCDGSDSVDYPDFAAAVANEVSNATVDHSRFICEVAVGAAIFEPGWWVHVQTQLDCRAHGARPRSRELEMN